VVYPADHANITYGLCLIESHCLCRNIELGSTKKKAEKMFLECYPAEKFDLFEIPVIALGC